MPTRRRAPWWVRLAFLPFVLCILAAIFLVQGGEAKLFGVTILGAVLFFVGVLTYWSLWSQEQRRREAQALVDWGAPRGLAHARKEPAGDSCTLFERSATFESVLRGPLVAGRAGSVSHVTLSLRRRVPLMMFVPFWGPVAEGDVDLWTAAQLTLKADEAKPLGRLVLSRRDLLDLPALAALSDRATSLRHVELESAELHDVYDLEVDDRADDVAVRRVFTPAFVVYLVERAGEPLLIEVRRRTLTVALRGQLLAPAELDRLAADVLRVAAAVAPATAREAAAVEPVRPARVPGLGRRARIASIVVGAIVLGGIFAFGAWSIVASPG